MDQSSTIQGKQDENFDVKMKIYESSPMSKSPEYTSHVLKDEYRDVTPSENIGIHYTPTSANLKLTHLLKATKKKPRSAFSLSDSFRAPRPTLTDEQHGKLGPHSIMSIKVSFSITKLKFTCRFCREINCGLVGTSYRSLLGSVRQLRRR